VALRPEDAGLALADVNGALDTGAIDIGRADEAALPTGPDADGLRAEEVDLRTDAIAARAEDSAPPSRGAEVGALCSDGTDASRAAESGATGVAEGLITSCTDSAGMS